jgi:hypothetical protein
MALLRQLIGRGDGRKEPCGDNTAVADLAGGKNVEPLRRNMVDVAEAPRRGGPIVRLRVAQFLALVFVALALVPSGAHLFALPNKMDLARDQYFVVQNIYRGWALFGIVLFGALFANLVLALQLRGRGTPFIPALVAFYCIVLSLLVFFIWTYPANQATDNWTTIPANWEQLRRQWEYSHAANALVTFVAFCSLTLSVLTRPE